MKDHPFENIPKRKSDTKSTPYTEQFEKLLAEKKAKGLLYTNIYYGKGLNKNTVNYEEFCEEFIRMENGLSVPDKEVLGKHSI